MSWLGYRAEDSTIEIYFTTHDGSGGAASPSDAFEAADVRIYKDGSETQKATTNGLTMTSPFDSVTGLHLLAIDTSNDTGDAGFWADGSRYAVVLSPDTETVDSQTVIRVVGEFILGQSSVNTTQIDGSTTAATNLKQSCLAIQTITVQTAEAAANTATTFDTDLPLENDNYYGSADGGLVIAFISGAANQFQTRRIVASSTGTANTRITLEEALDATPADGNVAVVLGRITELA